MNPGAVFLILASIGQYNYDDHTFGLQTNSSAFVLINDSGFFPSVQDNYIVRNIGRASIRAQLWYGDEVQWFGMICGATIEPGESKILDNGGKPYYYTGLKVFNDNPQRAIFHADGGDVYSPYTPGSKFDMFKYLRKTFGMGVKYIPVSSPGIFSDLISAFWPKNHSDLWTGILFEISPLLGQEHTKNLQKAINTTLNVYKDNLKKLTDETELAKTYMSLVINMKNIEENFVFPESNAIENKLLNAYILPLYSNTISMKLHFYILGIRNKEKLGLSNADIQNIIETAYSSYDSAHQHILSVSEGLVDYAYNNSDAPSIYNNMMTIRSHLAIHGSEYIPIWKYKIDNPLNETQIYNPVVSYSTFFGKPTADLYDQSTPTTVPLPLNPNIDGTTVKNLTKMTVYMWGKDPSFLKIGGIKIYFDNGEEYTMGTVNCNCKTTEDVELEGVQILQITAYGEGKIEGLAFHLSNGNIKSFGNTKSSSQDFKLADHYIPSFYLSSDGGELDGQAANFAVAYQWYIRTPLPMNPGAVFLKLASLEQYNYDDHTFSLQTNSSAFVLINDSGFFPSVQDNYIVRNIGRASIRAQLWYGDEVQWFGVVCGATIEPGESKTLDNGGKPYYYTGLKVFNDNPQRAIFRAGGGDMYSPYARGSKFDMFIYLRKTFGLAIKYIPASSSGIFSDLISAFWPKHHADVWTEILFEISPLLEQEHTENLEKGINTTLNVYKDKLNNLTDETELARTYMSLVLDMKNIEEDFASPESNTIENKLLNAYMLPLYSNAVSMKLHFYILGIRNKEKLGLSNANIQNIIETAYSSYYSAYQHILSVSEGLVDYAYNNSDAPNIYNNMMTIRSHLAIHGSEYIPIWKYQIDNPLNETQIYNPVVSYSTFFGKPTANLYAQSTPPTIPLPLNPNIDGITTKNLTKMTVYMWDKDPSFLKIGGIKIYFDNGEEYTMGTVTATTEDVELEGVQILQITAYGEGKIDGLAFYLSNGTIKSFGNRNSSSQDFKFAGHYIPSFYLSSDDGELDGQAANFAVAYQWYIRSPLPMNSDTVFPMLASLGQYNYDDKTFSLQTNSSAFVLINDSGFFPWVQDNYIVRNIGRAIVRAQLWYGDEVQWFGVVCGATIEPGESKILDNGGKPYYYTGLKVFNDDPQRAIFHADGGDVYSPYTPSSKFDMFKYLRKTFGLAIKYIPVSRPGIFLDLISAFWPKSHADVWTEILFEISPLLGQEHTINLQNAINTTLNVYKDKLKNLSDETEPAKTYMSLVLEMKNIEENFVFPESNTIENKLLNAYMLPLYSNTISMKLHFYILGIRNKEKLGLSNADIQNITETANSTYDSAYQHILSVSEGIVDYAYNNSDAPNIYNNMMTIRSHLAIHGSEYTAIWKYKINNPLNESQIYNPVVSYSTFFGKPTADLYAQSTPTIVPQPLNPNIDGTTVKNLRKITVYMWCKDPRFLKIGGIKIYFDNGEKYTMGNVTAITKNVELEGVQILQISAYGEGKIEGLAFYLSNGNIKSFGNTTSSSQDFKLADHYISSFYLSSDRGELGGQAANFAVAYQWYIR